MRVNNKIYTYGYWGVTIFIALLIASSVLLPELRKDGVVSDEFAAMSKTPLWTGLGLCGFVMWVYAIQRLSIVWKWSPVNKKISGVMFVLLFPGLCGYYLFFMDRQEAEREVRKVTHNEASNDSEFE